MSYNYEVTTAGYIFPRWYLKKQGVDNFEKYNEMLYQIKGEQAELYRHQAGYKPFFCWHENSYDLTATKEGGGTKINESVTIPLK